MAQAEQGLDLYKVANETWRFQVQQFWTRNSYFAAFETAALAGVIKLLEAQAGLASLFSAAGIVLTLLWFFSNDRLQEYIRFWWSKMMELEEANALSQPDPNRTALRLAADFSRWRGDRPTHRPRWPWRYSSLVQVIPILFVILWVALFFVCLKQWR